MTFDPFKDERDLRAWVVFDDNADLPTLRRILKPGFRHCWVLIWDGKHYLSIDPLSSHMEVMGHYHLPPDFDLPAWLSDRYHAVVEAPVSRMAPKVLPLKWISCVEIAKQFLGIRKFSIWTPWDLYQHLKELETQRDITWEKPPSSQTMPS